MLLTLTELGTAPIHTGRFGGSVMIQQYSEATSIDKNDQILTCAITQIPVVMPIAMRGSYAQASASSRPSNTARAPRQR